MSEREGVQEREGRLGRNMGGEERGLGKIYRGRCLRGGRREAKQGIKD